MIGTFFYIIDFCFIVMCLVCVLPDVCSIFAGTMDGLYIMLVGAGDIIMYAITIICDTGFIMIPILVGDLFFSMGMIFLFFYIGISIVNSLY